MVGPYLDQALAIGFPCSFCCLLLHGFSPVCVFIKTGIIPLNQRWMYAELLLGSGYSNAHFGLLCIQLFWPCSCVDLVYLRTMDFSAAQRPEMARGRAFGDKDPSVLCSWNQVDSIRASCPGLASTAMVSAMLPVRARKVFSTYLKDRSKAQTV